MLRSPSQRGFVRVITSGYIVVLLAGCSTVRSNTTPAQVNHIRDSQHTQSQNKDLITNKLVKEYDFSLKIAAVGDIMLGTNYPLNHLPDPGINLLKPVYDVLAAADVTFGNLEGVLTEHNIAAKSCTDTTRCYVFRSPPEFSQQLQQAGFDVMSLANNHARDFGEQGRLETMSALDSSGIRHSGQAGDIASWRVNGRLLALIAFAPFRGANDMLDIAAAKRIVQELAASHDIVMVSMHGGAEGENMTKIPFGTEMYFGENRGDVVKFARAVVDAGADLVLGHGPHVPRAMELYAGRLIAYSLGNFCTYYGISVKNKRGLAPILELSLGYNGEFKHGMIHSFRQQRPAGPEYDPYKQAAKLIARLSQQDFPESPLHINNNGIMTIRKTK